MLKNEYIWNGAVGMFSLFLTVFIYLGFLAPVPALAFTSGPNSPSAAVGSVWTNQANVYSQDGAFASFGATSQNWLVINSYGFSLPTDAVVTGVSATIWGYGLSTVESRRQIRVALTTDGSSPSGSAKTAVQLGTSNGSVIVGGGSDTWNAALTPTVVNSSNFGIMISDNDANSNLLYIDHVSLTITYTIPDTTPPAVTGFVATTPSTSLAIPITSFTGSDNVGVAKYTITTSDIQPDPVTGNWSEVAPSTF